MSRIPVYAACHHRVLAAALVVALGCAAGPVAAQALTPAFTYQGELRLASGPATGNYDMIFMLIDAPTGGMQIGPSLTVNNVPVTAGLFSVPLDFGWEQFAGERQWLQIQIRPAGSGTFEALSPRTEVTAAPYAWSARVALANSVTSTSIVDGTVGTSDINATQVQRRVSGTCPAGQYVRVVAQDGSLTCNSDANSGGTVTSIATGAGLSGGPITVTGTISVAPGGIGATEINATQVQRRVTGTCSGSNYVQQVNQDGTVACGPAPAASGWSLTGNAGTNPATNFIGTTDNQPLVLRVNNLPALRIEPNAASPNFVGGASANTVTAEVVGATISGGGDSSNPNRVDDDYSTISGGFRNRVERAAETNARYATIGGGFSNIATRTSSTIGGGAGNTASGFRSTVGGGSVNSASSEASTVGGGESNMASSARSTVAGGSSNTASGTNSTVGGGFANTARGSQSTVGGGANNCAGGDLSWAGGRRAKARPGVDPSDGGSCSGLVSYAGGSGDVGTFVWADSQDANFVSTGSNQFLVRAQGGMAINTNSPAPGSSLTVAGASTLNGAVAVNGASTLNGNVAVSPP